MSRPPARDSGREAAPSDTLWVGHISSATVEEDLLALFSGHGALDCVLMHGTRSFAFVFFRSVEDARVAKNALQGAQLHGSFIRIDFSRPARPNRNLWVGRIGFSVTKEQLEDEFMKFGKIEKYKFFRDRNSALIDFERASDAISAQSNLNEKQIGGEQIRVEFLRPQPLKRDFSDLDSRDCHFSSRKGPSVPWTPPDRMRNFHGLQPFAQKDEPSGGQRDGNLSNILWIGYPSSLFVNEERVHNSMILFGEIEKIKCFPSRNYCFVEFRSIEEARRAKEGLEGHLFGDSRVQILYSTSRFPPKDSPLLLAGHAGQRTDPFSNEPPFGPVEGSGSAHLRAPHNFPGISPLATHDTPNDFGGFPRKFADDSLTRRHHSAEPSGKYPQSRPMSCRPDVLDTRDPKRMRNDQCPDVGGAVLHARRMADEDLRDSYASSHLNRDGSHSHEMCASSSSDHSWHGALAKGGVHVCCVRCVPIGRGIDAPFPEVVNCSARTGLDMLAKHYDKAKGFDIVLFLPDSEEDFASYTEFLRYLGLKNRAGVAKLDDGTTMFLIPPSDFLRHVLNVEGPERLYGVVLHLLVQSASVNRRQSQLCAPPQTLPSIDQSYPSPNEDQVLKVDSNQGLQLQKIVGSSEQGTSEEDADKSRRYQSTLQLAASLLLQIHRERQQQQQQVHSQDVEGSENQTNQQ